MGKKRISREQRRRQRTISIVLICVLIVAAAVIPLRMLLTGEQQTFDYFYIQLYNSDDQVVSKYKVTLTGMFSGLSSRITDVAVNYESGDKCETSYSVDGNKVLVTVTHPTEGYLEKTLILNANGTFSGY